MDGENNGKPYFLMDDLGGKPRFSETLIVTTTNHITENLERLGRIFL